MADKQKTKIKGGSQNGKGKYAQYRADVRNRKNSIKRIFNSQGEAAVLAYAKVYGIETWAKRRIANLAAGRAARSGK